MVHNDLSSPLLGQPSPSHQSEVILTVDQSSENNTSRSIPLVSNKSHRGSINANEGEARGDPYTFIGSDGFHIPEQPSVDPFHNHTPRVEGAYEYVKILVCFPVAVVRLVLFAVCLSVGFLATKLALQGWKDRQNPMPKWRSRVMWITRLCTRCILFSFGYHWIKRKGKPAPRETAPIVVSNHVSYVEPIFFFYELFPTIVASESHDSLPLVGTIIRAMQVIYVNRFSSLSRKQAVNEIKRKASCGRFPRVLLFPEGTTTNGRGLLSFQLGAFIPGYPIQPVVVRYPHVHFDQSWGHISLGKLMFRMFTQFHNFMEVEYLPVISPLENQKENAVHFAQRTSRAIATNLNVVQTSHSFSDLMLLIRACESKQENPSNYMVEMARLESTFDISTLEALDFLNRFLSMNPDPSGSVTFDKFLKVQRLKACKLAEKVFSYIDVEKNGKITFRQFLYGSAHVLKQPLFQRACELAFSECDSVGRNYISVQEFGVCIKPAIQELNEDELHELFALFDSDGDGVVRKEDFLACLRRNPLLIALFGPCLMHRDLSKSGR